VSIKITSKNRKKAYNDKIPLQYSPESETPNSLCWLTVRLMFEENRRKLRQRLRFVIKAMAKITAKPYTTNNHTNKCKVTVKAMSLSTSSSTVANK